MRHVQEDEDVVYIKCESGFLPLLKTNDNHVIGNCNLPYFQLSAWQVGRITQLYDKSWMEIALKRKTGPWLDLSHLMKGPVGGPFTLLHSICDVSVNLGTRQETKTIVFDINRDCKPTKSVYEKS